MYSAMQGKFCCEPNCRQSHFAKFSWRSTIGKHSQPGEPAEDPRQQAPPCDSVDLMTKFARQP
jgi:hypothetical protein